MTVSINGQYSHEYINGVLVKETLNPANEIVNRGHYAATTLSAVDVDLATGNIRDGITLFGFAGTLVEMDVSDADAAIGEVMAGKTFYSVATPRKTGTLATRTLNPANETVQDGYYAATTLSAVDVDLAATNIKSGVVIFGFTGVATVQDIADADAVLADVKTGKTFYSVTGGRKTGNLATVSLSAAANAYPAGYHAGAASLTAVDADLATGNIKSGITIFGVAGSADVRDISDADLTAAEAPTGKFFYAVSGGRKTGTGTKTLSAANETVAAGYYAATTLSAVDGDLAVGNIADGVTIFGFLGTFSPALIDDILGAAETAYVVQTTSSLGRTAQSISGAGDITIATKTQSYAAGSRAVAAAFINCSHNNNNMIKLRLFMGGVQVVETAFITGGNDYVTYTLEYIKALSGSQECKLEAHNYNGGSQALWLSGGRTAGEVSAAAIVIGSVKT